MSQIKERNTRYLTNEDEPPAKKLLSDADIFIKQLAERQRNTSTNLQEQLANSKEFTKATELIPLGIYSTGTTSLKRFQEATQHNNKIEMLKAAGLTNEEVELYFDNLNDDDYVFKKHKNWEASLLRQQLNDLQAMVKRYEEKQLTVIKSNEIKQIQKHASIERGLTVKPESIETKLLKFALENRKEKSKSAFSNPMDDIKRIEQNRFEQRNESALPSISSIRRKARKLQHRIDNVSQNKNFVENGYQKIVSPPEYSLVKESKWDVKIESKPKMKIFETKTYTCLPQHYYTIRNGAILKLNENEVHERELPSVSRLSVEEIKMLPKFQNYECGNPSKVLYIKNISKSIKEDDLRYLFKSYDKDQNLSYRVMKGKMRGQAFVTFSDEATATRALEEFNGVVIKNKPIIIQFGCAKDKE